MPNRQTMLSASLGDLLHNNGLLNRFDWYFNDAYIADLSRDGDLIVLSIVDDNYVEKTVCVPINATVKNFRKLSVSHGQ